MRSLGFKAILIGFWEMMDLALGNYFYVMIAKIINNEGMRLIRCKKRRLDLFWNSKPFLSSYIIS